MASSNKAGKMQFYVNYRMRATMDDGRQLAGQMLAFDKHMNLVLADTEEFRRVKQKKKAAAPGATSTEEIEVEDKRTLGLTIVRGTHVISLTVDGPPPADPSARLGQSAPGGGPVPGGAALASGPGTSRPAGRGMPIGLTGPAFGVGGPMAPGGGPPGGFAPPGFPGRGGPPGFGGPPGGFGGPPGAPPGFQPPPGFQGGPPGAGRGFPGGPPPGFGR